MLQLGQAFGDQSKQPKRAKTEGQRSGQTIKTKQQHNNQLTSLA